MRITMETSTKPRRQFRILTCLGLVVVLLLGTTAFMVLLYTRLGVHPNGTRISLVGPGGGQWVSTRQTQPVKLPADLEADGLRVTGGGSTVEGEQMLIIRRQRFIDRIVLTAGRQPIETAKLGYVLYDKDGAELSQGVLQPSVRIEPGQAETVEIADGYLPDAARIEIRRLP
jgi:hypothetical protein